MAKFVKVEAGVATVELSKDEVQTILSLLSERRAVLTGERAKAHFAAMDPAFVEANIELVAAELEAVAL